MADVPVLKPFDDLRWRADKFWDRTLPRAEPPSRLYHYTSSDGLFGILQSGVIRGSNQAFLNDRSEFSYGAHLARRVLSDRVGDTDTLRRFTAAVGSSSENPRGFFHFDLYVASFCETHDLLSQWRGYGTSSGRYCIELDTRQLRLATFPHTFPASWPVPMIYESNLQQTLLSEIAERFIETFPRILRRYGESDNTYKEAAEVFLRCCQGGILRFKHASFQEEREWRASQFGYSRVHSKLLHFVPRDGVMVPMVDLLKSGDGLLPVTRITVGPSRQPDRLVRSAELMCSHFGYHEVAVDVTGIPLSA